MFCPPSKKRLSRPSALIYRGVERFSSTCFVRPQRKDWAALQPWFTGA